MIGNDVMENINYELLAIRVIESNLTFKDLERETNISRSTLHNVITGKTKPSYPVARLLSEHLLLTKEDVIAIYFPNAISEKELAL